MAITRTVDNNVPGTRDTVNSVWTVPVRILSTIVKYRFTRAPCLSVAFLNLVNICCFNISTANSEGRGFCGLFLA